jgi:hypothetical protein
MHIVPFDQIDEDEGYDDVFVVVTSDKVVIHAPPSVEAVVRALVTPPSPGACVAAVNVSVRVPSEELDTADAEVFKITEFIAAVRGVAHVYVPHCIGKQKNGKTASSSTVIEDWPLVQAYGLSRYCECSCIIL